MKKTLNDMAKYIQDLIPANIPNTYTLKPMIKGIGSDDAIRSGVIAFRDFLILLCGRLIADGSKYEKPLQKAADDVHDHTSLTVKFPFLNNVKSILVNIGYYGVLSDSGDTILLGDWQTLTTAISAEGNPLRARISVPKLIECLRFLASCGIGFDGIDLGAEKTDLSKVEALTILYPDNPHMLTGLKVMAIAQKELYTRGNDELFMRCDYSVIKKEDTDITTRFMDFLNLLPIKAQAFALRLHRRYLDMGMKCKMEVRYLRVRFVYSYKNKEIWMFSTSLNHGSRIFIRAVNTHQYTDTIEKFPLILQEIVAGGYGCDKKRFGEPCQGSCHGFRIPLDESVLEISREIEIWLDKELVCL